MFSSDHLVMETSDIYSILVIVRLLVNYGTFVTVIFLSLDA